ncbi:MAG: biopolymer transporter ExbD [Vampirovibrionales bacterium]|nr:biopolymer transporter ExbD [Vampirovibrionales bacterium]
MHATHHRTVFNEINITPLTDIFLVLLIIMMVVAPMMRQQQADIQPPTLVAGQSVDQDKLTVEINAQGQFFVDGEAAPAEGLTTALQQKKAQRLAQGLDVAKDKENLTSEAEPLADPLASAVPTKDTRTGVLIIRADKTTKSGAVLSVFDAARDAGYAKVTISGQKAPNGGSGKGTMESSQNTSATPHTPKDPFNQPLL